MSITSAAIALPTLAADRVTFYYPPFFEASISVDSLEVFADDGTIADELTFYARFVEPDQIEALRDILQRRFRVSAITVSQFTYTEIGEILLRQLGQVLRTESNQNGFYSLRAALLQAAARNPEGLTIIDLLRAFPVDTIRVDVRLGLDTAEELSSFFLRRDAIVAAIQQKAILEAAANPIDASALPDLRTPGRLRAQTLPLSFSTANRERAVAATLYLPEVRTNTPVEPAPVIVISHGIASDRTTFAYLAQHLASHGYVVALVEHPDTSARRFEQFFSGFDYPPDSLDLITRPLDITALLDELERRSQTNPSFQGRMDLDRVGVIGQSLGGYTVLALAGAQLNFPRIRQECVDPELRQLSFNLSILLQCRAIDLPSDVYNLQDDRVKAVLAINPIDSLLFGQEGMSQIQIPTMIVAGSEDIFAPPPEEQFHPFHWLTTDEKYLVVLGQGTHFSFLNTGRQRGVLPVPPDLIGPDPVEVQPYLKVLSTAFFNAYLNDNPTYLPYLSASYLHSIDQDPFSLSLVRELTEEQLNAVP
ncbi:MAG: alpha/beta hydrolase [Leptolyngbyaceae cyanobacterium SL_7_1]|nr:alpha/beta hydrolase [Leptolyngbyaceae cyanobacterium SL_7_1]